MGKLSFCQLASPWVTVAYSFVKLSEVEGGGDDCGDFLLGGPDVAQEDGLAGLVLAEGVVVEVVVDAAGERVGDDQRRRHEVVGAHVGVDAAFEVAIAAEHGDGDQAVLFDGLARRRSGSGPELPMQVVQP